MNNKGNTRVKRISISRNPVREEVLPCNDPGNCVEINNVSKDESIVPEVCPGGRCSIQRPSRRASRARRSRGRRSAGSASNRRRRRSTKNNARNRRSKKK
ncbi:unnamed protein product [Allacma fusca]|uniref:Uncharacterized protein n=1 Tax=Allacma fusca TaxID=39272 RepID=A0A8J2LNL2_9HEXA|nr:unnamed protein product [Allacma fusca]